MDVIVSTNLGLKSFIKGKVRDIYDLGDYLLIVATDRISAFDVVLPEGIPLKGAVLNQISIFWFEQTKNIVSNHVVEPVFNVTEIKKYLEGSYQTIPLPSYLSGRAMIVKKVKRLPVECVVRGYLAGSGWSEYTRNGTVCGISLPSGLRESEELPEPIFTPTTKAESGHDMPLKFEGVEYLVGEKLAASMRDISISIYRYARDYARERGLIIADTKMEFGVDDSGKLILIDELLTPDSSRFWDMASYKVGQSQESYDKQPVRDWLSRTGWNKEPPAPHLPPEIVESTSERYRTAFEKITGKKLILTDS